MATRSLFPQWHLGMAHSYGSGGSRNYALDFNPTSANVSVGNVTFSAGGSRVGLSLTLGGTSVGNMVTGVISSNISLPVTKSGPGTWTLSGDNTYNGTTTISGGVLSAAAAALSPNSAYAINGGTLDVSVSGGTIASLNMGGGGALNLGLGYTLSSTGAASLGGTLNILGSFSPSTGKYELISYGSKSSQFASVTGLSSSFTLVYGTGELDAQQKAGIANIATALSASNIITGGTAPFTFTVANPVPTGGAALNFSASAGANVSGGTSGTVAANSTSSPISGLSFSGTSVGLNQTGSFIVSDSNSLSSPQTGTVTVNVYGHALPALSGPSVNNQTVITGGSLVPVTFTLTNAGTYLAGASVGTLSNLTGNTGTGAVVANNGSGVYTATGFNTTAVGVNKTLSVSLYAGDEQDLSGFTGQTQFSQSATYTVLGHANPVVTPVTLDFGNVHAGYAGTPSSTSSFTVTNSTGGAAGANIVALATIAARAKPAYR